MRRLIALAGVLVAALAVSAILAGTASATSQNLVLYSVEAEEVLVTPGQEFDMVLYHWNNEALGPNAFLIETTTGTAECTGTEFPFSGLRGTDVTNSEPKDQATMSEPAGVLAASNRCSNTSVLGAEAEMALLPQGATLVLSGSKGKTELKQKSPAEPIILEVGYSGGAFCAFKATKLKGTLTFAPQGEWQQLVLTFTKDKVKLLKEASSEGCDKHTTVSASFGFQSRSDEGGFGEGHFIFGKLV